MWPPHACKKTITIIIIFRQCYIRQVRYDQQVFVLPLGLVFVCCARSLPACHRCRMYLAYTPRTLAVSQHITYIRDCKAIEEWRCVLSWHAQHSIKYYTLCHLYYFFIFHSFTFLFPFQVEEYFWSILRLGRTSRPTSICCVNFLKHYLFVSLKFKISISRYRLQWNHFPQKNILNLGLITT